MSNTRRAADGGELNQERFASSPAIERGLNAVPVKLRCETLRDERDIELVWFLQFLSCRPGGIVRVAEDVLAAYPERLGTNEMREFGTAHEAYNANQVRAIRSKVQYLFDEDEFILRGEERFSEEDEDLSHMETTALMLDKSMSDIQERKAQRRLVRITESKLFPTSYPVEAFLKICRKRFLTDVPAMLTSFCLDPAFSVEKLRCDDEIYENEWFDDLHGALLDYMARWEKDRLAKLVVTEVGRKILDALDFAEAERSLVLIEGEYGTGKTFITKAWCEARPGKRRYIQAPSSNDSLDFFRTVAEPIGVSHALSMKSQQMRARINGVLQAGHLTVVIDEAHYMFPQASARVALPAKINWIMTALTNHGVPVALVATPQFTSAQLAVERQTHWASGQFIGRISLFVRLAETLGSDDLRAIAKSHLPDGDAKSIDALVLYAEASKKRLRGIENGIKAARHVARKAGRDKVTFADIKEALRGSVMASDNALNEALNRAPGTASAPRLKRSSKVFAAPLQTPRNPLSKPTIPERETGATLSNSASLSSA